MIVYCIVLNSEYISTAYLVVVLVLLSQCLDVQISHFAAFMQCKHLQSNNWPGLAAEMYLYSTLDNIVFAQFTYANEYRANRYSTVSMYVRYIHYSLLRGTINRAIYL